MSAVLIEEGMSRSRPPTPPTPSTNPPRRCRNRRRRSPRPSATVVGAHDMNNRSTSAVGTHDMGDSHRFGSPFTDATASGPDEPVYDDTVAWA